MKTLLAFFDACLNGIRPASGRASSSSRYASSAIWMGELCIHAVSFECHFPSCFACSTFPSVPSLFYLVFVPFPTGLVCLPFSFPYVLP
ncbi:hypothetical protein FIBSPDRAFT_876736 [Athelia psychrophila]|uniref:Uncharacterized protein n=1 Tax=Athelia psychrophila TaxID=1759441 RepID=A0A167WKI3_9AGAM|nr:hypothetical protein FIBSPDRAFT_876736 [Fibularhizoctonia sp. CBS 109695]